MSARKHILTMLLVLCSFTAAMAQKRSKLVIAHNHLMLLIDPRDDKNLIDSLLKAAGVNGVTADKVLRGNYEAAIKNGWNVYKNKKGILQFDISLLDKTEPLTPYVLTSINTIRGNMAPGYPVDVLYGVNNFSRVTVHELPSGLTRFFVPMNLDAKRVLLSGNFNHWSTIKGLMNRTDSGWVMDVRLEPGKYYYKFIINGRWTTDVNNRQQEGDGAGNTNSVYFRYNYTFKLVGYRAAKQVSVAGSFNKWRLNELPMRLLNGIWQASLYLHDGIHLYRFMVDGGWIPDPANKSVQKDGDYFSSVLKLGEVVTFRLNGYQDAKNVYVAGDFNNWNPTMLRMEKTGGGWSLPYTLPAGNYQYKFLVDGNWITDPLNPHRIEIDGHSNSFMALRPNYTFRLKGFGDARTIRLAGSFNDWNPNGYTLEHRGDEWVISMRLKPGKYLYKFLVDGRWIIDPGNKLWEQNEYNTGNSVLWIE